ncbi:hypothetical protein [Polaribacter atrinae]|uniref:hypothetical protein n=1 Tax=Polaribacter atrinae TaxID=1333662 RepID=UPI0024921F2B|nr:hypothetical protein [Polaribacter atrinae]
MKEQLKKVSSLIEQIDDVKNKDDYNLIRNQIIEELLNVFLDASKGAFITAISLKVLKPIQDEINVAIHFIETKRSRSFRSERLKMLSRKDFLINLRNQILIGFKEQLKEVELYKEFLIGKANNRFLILNPTQDYPIEIFTSNRFDNILKEATNKVTSYFENQLLTMPTYKDELFLFDSRVDKCIIENEIEIEKINQYLIDKKEEQKENIKSLSDTEKEYFYSHPSEKHNLTSTIEVNRIGFIDYLFESQIDFSYHNELEMLKMHITALEKLQNNLPQSYLFLKINKPKKETPLTVFGDREVSKLEDLFFELEYFLDTSIQVEDIVNVFSLNYETSKKIDLRNGTTNDFAYFINKIQPYFINEIADRKEYNQWWADRFTFNGVEKVKKAISTMRSNTKKGGIRQQVNTTRINSIVNVLI